MPRVLRLDRVYPSYLMRLRDPIGRKRVTGKVWWTAKAHTCTEGRQSVYTRLYSSPLLILYSLVSLSPSLASRYTALLCLHIDLPLSRLQPPYLPAYAGNKRVLY